MNQWIAIIVLFASGVVGATCRNSGRIQFRDVVGAPGFYVQGLFGVDSYQAYLHGKEFSKGEAENGTDGNYFFLDGTGFQHFALPREKYLPNTVGLSEKAELEAHYAWELNYLKELQKSGRVKLEGHTSYGVVESEIIDGSKRNFFIWEAKLSGAKQYFITTQLSFGVLVLTAIGVEPENEGRAREVIDNYMYRFTKLKDSECET